MCRRPAGRGTVRPEGYELGSFKYLPMSNSGGDCEPIRGGIGLYAMGKRNLPSVAGCLTVGLRLPFFVRLGGPAAP